jgi:hypothetical protein
MNLQEMHGYEANQSDNVHSLRQELPWWNLKPRKEPSSNKANPLPSAGKTRAKV